MEILNILFDSIINNWEIISLFFFIAVLYSSVGFGGGSSYLAILSLFSFAFVEMRAISLICNIAVVSGNVFTFRKIKAYNWKKVLPLVFISIPLAFIGGKLQINNNGFQLFLALTLIIAALFMLGSKYVKNDSKETRNNSIKDYFYGGSVGFVSGAIGLGGGVFLAPLLHLTKWDTPKRIAAASSLFILANSISGLFGQAQNPNFYFEPYFTFVLIITVLLGGQIGSRMREKIISPIVLKRLTAVLIAFVGFRLLFKLLF